MRITAIYMGPGFTVVTNNRHSSSFLVSHVTISLKWWCLSSWSIGVNDVPVACITDIGFYSAARFRINDLEYKVNSWPEIIALNSLPDACEISFVTFVYRCYSQTVYAIRDNPIRKIFFTTVVKPLDYRAPVNWNGAENCFVLANIKC